MLIEHLRNGIAELEIILWPYDRVVAMKDLQIYGSGHIDQVSTALRNSELRTSIHRISLLLVQDR